MSWSTSSARDLLLPGLASVEETEGVELDLRADEDLGLIVWGSCPSSQPWTYTGVLFTKAELLDGTYKKEFGPRLTAFAKRVAAAPPDSVETAVAQEL